MTYTPTAEHSKQIRQALKAKYGWTGQDVSVRTDNYSMGSSIRIKVKNPTVDKAIVEEIAKDHEHVYRCEMTGDILSGGNRFVFVDYTDDCRKQIGAPYLEAVTAIRRDPESQSTGWTLHEVGRCSVGIEHDSEQEWNRYYHVHPPQEDEARSHSECTYGPGHAAYLVGYFSDVLKPEDPEPQAEPQEDQADGPVDSAPGVAFQRNTEKGGLELVFEEKPSDMVRLKLKTNKWRWSPKQGLWYTRQSAAAEEIARWVVDKYRSGATEDESHTDPYSSPDAFDMMVEDDMCRRAGA